MIGIRDDIPPGKERTDTEDTNEAEAGTDIHTDTRVVVQGEVQDVTTGVQIAIVVLTDHLGEVLPLVISHSHLRTK